MRAMPIKPACIAASRYVVAIDVNNRIDPIVQRPNNSTSICRVIRRQFMDSTLENEQEVALLFARNCKAFWEVWSGSHRDASDPFLRSDHGPRWAWKRAICTLDDFWRQGGRLANAVNGPMPFQVRHSNCLVDRKPNGTTS